MYEYRFIEVSRTDRYRYHVVNATHDDAITKARKHSQHPLVRRVEVFTDVNGKSAFVATFVNGVQTQEGY